MVKKEKKSLPADVCEDKILNDFKKTHNTNTCTLGMGEVRERLVLGYIQVLCKNY